MASEREILSFSGPVHLTTIDWNNFHHRKSIAASLVQGVYIQERDRQKKRHGPQALAPPWWESFNFQLTSVLVDDADFSIFGAIYEFKPQAYYYNYPAHGGAPKYVVAFRGTLLKPDSMPQDAKLNFKLICNKLDEESPRFKIAMRDIQKIMAVAGAINIWLAGHSLGSAMAMLVGKNMAKMNCPIETYLFNPPFISVPIDRIKDQKLKHGIRVASSVLKAGIAVAVKGHHERPQDNPFDLLSSWIPYLFVNPADHICSEYIGYFEHRKKMKEIGAEKIERVATRNSIGSLFLGAMGKDSEPLHLLPSANLTINLCPAPNFGGAHEIDQWWKTEYQYCQSKLYQFR